MRIAIICLVTFLAIGSSALSQSSLTGNATLGGRMVKFAPAPKPVLHVPGDYATIQAAIVAAGPGTTILVAPGTYVENIDFLGKSIIVRSDLDGNPSTDDLSPTTTIIDGGSPADPNRGSVATFQSGEGAAAVLRGFTLTNGSGTYLPAYFSRNGGGVFCQDASPTITENIIANNLLASGGPFSDGAAGIAVQRNASPLISYNLITGNVVAYGVAGGIGIGDNCAPLILGNTISSNTATGSAGGGVLCGTNSDATIEENTIAFNQSQTFGGGVFAYNCSVTLRGNVIMDNQSGEGGGIYSEDSTALIVNNVVADNRAVTNGGGLFCFDGIITITNNTIHGNSGINLNYYGGGIHVRGFAQGSGFEISVTNSIVWNNLGRLGFPSDIRHSLNDTLVVSYSDVGVWLGSGPGNIDLDPLLVDPANGDFHLSLGSPCLDSGDNLAPGIQATDYEGDPRILDGDAIPGAVVDMGADERAP